MTKTVIFEATLESLRKLEIGVAGYVAEKQKCFLVLASGSAIRISAVATDVTQRFECFSLALDIVESALRPMVEYLSFPVPAAVSVLMREEYVTPYAGDEFAYVGSNPTSQRAVRPGQVPTNAIASCLVAFGLLVKGHGSRLVVAADWFPFDVETTTDEVRVAAHLVESEEISIERYIELYGTPSQGSTMPRAPR
jgi:hypothetical protein